MIGPLGLFLLLLSGVSSIIAILPENWPGIGAEFTFISDFRGIDW